MSCVIDCTNKRSQQTSTEQLKDVDNQRIFIDFSQRHGWDIPVERCQENEADDGETVGREIGQRFVVQIGEAVIVLIDIWIAQVSKLIVRSR